MIELDIDGDIELTSEAGALSDGIHSFSNKDYHALDGISSTGFKIMEKSQSAFKHREKFKMESTSLITGELLHVSILEPHLLVGANRLFIEADTVGSDTISANHLRDKNPDKVVTGKGTIMEAQDLAESFRSVFPEIFSDPNTRYEVSVLYNSEDTGTLHKCRPDVLYKRPDGKYIIFDLKSTKYATRQDFANRTISDFWYHVSAAWYIDTCIQAGIDVVGFGWLCIPTAGERTPYAAMASGLDIEIGREKYGELTKKYIEYQKSGIDEDKYRVVYSRDAARKMREES